MNTADEQSDNAYVSTLSSALYEINEINEINAWNVGVNVIEWDLKTYHRSESIGCIDWFRLASLFCLLTLLSWTATVESGHDSAGQIRSNSDTPPWTYVRRIRYRWF